MPTATAITYGAMEGATTATGYQLGVGGAITVLSPNMNPSGFVNHRDYMLYINDATVQGTLGAGYYTQDGTTFYDMVYRYPHGGPPNHDLYNSIPLNTNINAQVTEQNDNPDSHCFVAFAYQTPSTTLCFTTAQHGASNIGAVARTFSAYSNPSNDLYGYMYNLKSRYYRVLDGYVDWENFSVAAAGTYKCSIGSNYVLSYQPTKDTIGTGPRTYTSNSCTNQEGFEPYGESATAGGTG
jgi:hypothetical protein